MPKKTLIVDQFGLPVGEPKRASKPPPVPCICPVCFGQGSMTSTKHGGLALWCSNCRTRTYACAGVGTDLVRAMQLAARNEAFRASMARLLADYLPEAQAAADRALTAIEMQPLPTAAAPPVQPWHGVRRRVATRPQAHPRLPPTGRPALLPPQ